MALSAEVAVKDAFWGKWIQWIKFCVSTTKFSILINGSPVGYFSSRRGLRQGDPLSPYLFLLVMEVLSQMIKTAVRSGWIKGFKMEGHSGNNIEISHSLYADDTLLMCEADRNQVLHLSVVLFAFEAVIGLKINLAKSSMFSLNADSDINMLADIMGCKVEKFPTTYLGLPLGAKFKDKSVWNGVIDKCEK